VAKTLAVLFTTIVLWATCPQSHAASAFNKVVVGHVLLNARAAPLWIAKEQGFFAKHGLNAEVILVRGSPILAAAMSSGEIELGFTGGTAVLGAAVGGADLKLLANFTTRLTQDLIVRSGIRTAQDLRGKKLGIVSIGGTTWMVAILGLEHLGLEPGRDKINLMPIGDQTVLAQALLAGTIDATILDSVYSRRLQEKGCIIMAEFAKANIPLASVGVVARAAVIEKKPLVIENALKALVEANAYVHNPANKAVTLNVLRRRLKIGEREAEEGFQDMLLGLDRKPYPSLEGMRNIQRLMKVHNPKAESVRVEDLVDQRFLRKLDESGFIDRLYSAPGDK
jgi:ABC-type nitrate/sulfonate/bicarbonate transport system substrate-binding protein